MPNKLVSIVLLTWNGSCYIEACLDAVAMQTYSPLEIVIVDNGSSDTTAELLRRYIPLKLTIPWKSEFLPVNTGFAKGVNRGIAHASGEYILTLNQDVVMDKDYISNLVEAIEKNSAAPRASATGKILKWSTDDNSNPIIDSAGHEIYTDRIVVARGKGKSADNFNESCAVFGVSAAAALYNRQTIEKVSEKGEIFDPDFFSYLEDIDLDYRLILNGYESVYVPQAHAKHAGAGSGGRKNFSIRFKAHTNRYLIWFKNEELKELGKDFLPILLQEIIQFVRTLFTSPFLFASWFVFPSKAKRALRRGQMHYSSNPRAYARLRHFIKPGRLTGRFFK